MKKRLLLIPVLTVIALAGASLRVTGQEVEDAAPYQRGGFSAERTAPSAANRFYYWLAPANWKPGETTEKYPLLIYMHGGGSKGEGSTKPLREELPRLLAGEDFRSRFPCFVLVPQCRSGHRPDGRPHNWVQWNNQQEGKPATWTIADDEPSEQLLGAMAALEEMLARFPIDQKRVYLSGVSMGGSASWNWASRDPQRFAALLTVCGLSETRRVEAIAKIPIWTFHGSEDDEVPVQRTRDLVDALRARQSVVRYTEYEGAGHGIAKRVFTEDNAAALRWLFEQSQIKAK